jgi:large subunit ribosomal protein L10
VDVLLTKEKKSALIDEISSALKTSPIVVFTDFSGMPVAASNKMRMEMYKQFGDNATYRVGRNTLIRTAVKKAELSVQEYSALIDGSTGVFYINDSVDPIEALKFLTEFAKKNSNRPVVKGGMLEGAIFDAKQAAEYAKLPSKQQLIAMVLGSLNAPISGLVNVMAGTLKKVLYALNAVKEQKEKAE